MDTRLLTYFLRVAELGSINKAAIDLNLSQPALSRHMAALEQEMGNILFHRSKGGVTLTNAGQMLADRVRPLLKQFTVLKEQVSEQSSGQLIIGFSPSWHHVFTSRYVKSLLDERMQLSLRVYEDVSHVLREYLSAGLVDLCIAPFDASASPAYRQTPLVREPLVLIGSKSSGLDTENASSISIIKDKKLVLAGKSNALRNYVERQILRNGLKLQLALETDTLTFCLDLATSGRAYTVLPAGVLGDAEINKNLSWTHLREMYITWSLYENMRSSQSDSVMTARDLIYKNIMQCESNKQWLGVELLYGKNTIE